MGGKVEPSYIADGNVKQCSADGNVKQCRYFGKQFGSLLKD
jgi:hypothetical protein